MWERLLRLFSSVSPGIQTDGITRETELKGDLGLNSLTTMLLAMAIEDEFGFRFEEQGELNTVGDVCDYIEKYATK